jgi:GNAT superfamily N-acetyltransferase
MPMYPSFKVRPMLLDDLDHAMNLSKAEGWNQTEKDWRLLIESPLNTCLVVENFKRIIGTATALSHSNKTAWIGMVLVDKDFRGQGAGKILMTHLLEKLRHFKSIKLDATPAGQPVYTKLGFVEEHKIYRITNPSMKKLTCDQSDLGIKPIRSERFREIIKFDKQIFGVDRTYLLETLFRNYPDKAFMIERNNKFYGYTLGRDGNRFNYIGPVFASSSGDAKKLLSEALKSLINLPVAVDVLQDKRDLIIWLESIGFTKQRHFVRMYLRSNPYPGIVKNQYLISGPEFG